MLRQCLHLCDTLILTGRIRYTETETRMNMEHGGVLRQCLRLSMTINGMHIVYYCVLLCIVVLVVATLDCIKANTDYEVRVIIITDFNQ